METGKEVVKISLNSIIPNRFQPRISFDEEALNDLANSIKMYGILQPLILRPLGDKYEIIAGERRYKAATIAGLSEVPAILVNLDDQTSAELEIIQNIQRKELTANEEAKSYKKLLDLGNYTQEQLAIKMGKNQSTIANKLRLLNLLPDTQEALMNNSISERHARSLLQLKDEPGKQREVLNRIIKERLTVKDTDELIKSMMGENNMNGFNQNTTTPSNNINSFNSQINGMPTYNDQQSLDFANFTTDSFDLGTLSDPNLDVPTSPLVNEPPKSVSTSTPNPTSTFDFSSSFIPNATGSQNTNNEANPTLPNFDSLLKVEEKPVVEEPKIPTVKIEQSPPPNQYFPSLEEKPANMNFGQAFTTTPVNNTPNISIAINNTRDMIKTLENSGFKIETTEMDLADSYQITIKINKN